MPTSGTLPTYLIPSYRLARACFSHEDNASYLRSLPEPEISTSISIDLVYQQSSSLIAKKSHQVPTLILLSHSHFPVRKNVHSHRQSPQLQEPLHQLRSSHHSSHSLVRTYLRPLTFHSLQIPPKYPRKPLSVPSLPTYLPTVPNI